MKQRSLLAIFLMVCLAACSSADDAPKAGNSDVAATARDFFFYSCVQEYLKANGIQNFDGSVGFAVEHSALTAEQMSEIYNRATAAAAAIPAPDYADPEHGLPPVLVLCRNAAAE